MNAQAQRPNPLHVLLVDDTDLDAEVIERMLRRFTISTRVTRACNGFEALACIEGSTDQPPLTEPYVILLDLSMPRMNGVEFLHAMIERRSVALPPTLVMTSSSRSRDADTVRQFPNCQFCVKPVPREMLEGFLSTAAHENAYPLGLDRGTMTDAVGCSK